MSEFCWSYDDDVPGHLTEISDSNFGHWTGGLTRYKENLITVGGYDWTSAHQKTELMARNQNGNFTWSAIESDFIFTPSQKISYHSLITIPKGRFKALLRESVKFLNFEKLFRSCDSA